MAQQPKRSPEEIEAWRKELELPGVTLKRIAEREEISIERVSQLVRPLNRRQKMERRVTELFNEGKNDEEIARQVHRQPDTVAAARLRLGLNRPRISSRQLRPRNPIVAIWYTHYALGLPHWLKQKS